MRTERDERIFGYVRTEDALRRTIANFARHLRPGGAAMAEASLSPDGFTPGMMPWLDVSETAEPRWRG